MLKVEISRSFSNIPEKMSARLDREGNFRQKVVPDISKTEKILGVLLCRDAV